MSTMECYCRLCAEQKGFNKFIHLNNNKRIYDEIIEKLYYVNADFINFFNYDSPLPLTVCIVCYESLNRTYDFISKVIRAQEILTNLLLSDKNAYTDNTLKNEVNLQLPESNKSIEPILNACPDSKAEVFALATDNEFDNRDFIENSIQNDTDVAKETPIISAVKQYIQKLNDIGVANDKSWSSYVWKCLYCDGQFLSIDMLRSHSKEVHNKCSAFSCVDCKFLKKNVDLETFVSHIKIHRVHLRNYCHYCNMFFADGLKLEDHVKLHFTEFQNVCTFCGEVLDSQQSLKHHYEFYTKKKKLKRAIRKHANSKEDLTCQLCKKVYKSPHTLKYHLLRHREDRTRDFVCDECGKAFYNLDMLKVHIMTHDRSNPQTCSICHKVYNTVDCLKRHVRNMHSDNRRKEFSCDRCDKVYHNKRGLIRHIMLHDNIRPHRCTVCDRAFMFSKELSNHVAIHSGSKPFSCPDCGKHFRLQRHLKAHKIVHTDNMPFACQYCSKTFRFKQILKNHELQHTGAKPYTCQECGMQFTNWSNYNKHMKRRHNIDTSKKKITPDGVFPIDPETGRLIHKDGTNHDGSSSYAIQKDANKEQCLIKHDRMILC